ncbi:hypothetical protein F5X68DRAFT_245722 [Plectosphaerella plurivora]|uniref:ATP-grasp domain-containing protein n=1 Tax=Plectosphaerella plurivora TaxID=936078 RepID=A0A9P9A7F9_9PEZI|nr:hypothetical protein F5X68DRAFT_245722 [Plectosphaerella plurivora]
MHSHLRNLTLIALSFILLPLSTFILLLARLRLRLRPQNVISSSPASSKTILVTGVGMTKGLVLARLFHRAGHRVIGADFSPYAAGSRSTSLSAYHVLRHPGTGGGAGGYLDSVLKVIEGERVDLWVSCSGVASAVDDGWAREVVEARTACRAVQSGGEQTRVLHDKAEFMRHTREAVGQDVPESHLVTSAREMLQVLAGDAKDGDSSGNTSIKGVRYVAKSVGLNDRSRGDMTLLPRDTQEETRLFVSRIAAMGISANDPWLLQEFIPGKEYCTHALVVRGRVRAFVACPSAELLMHYVALPDDSPLALAMLEFTRRQARSFGDGFTGHLSFDFIAREPEGGAQSQEDVHLYPIECNPRAHTAVVLFANTPGLVDEYMTVLESNEGEGSKEEDDSPTNNSDVDTGNPVTPLNPKPYYWIGHDLVTLLLLPTLRVLLLQISPLAYARGLKDFLIHLISWTDGTWDSLDPLPWWWLYHVYWPLQFLQSLARGPAWSRVNVSTTKMFECD